MAVVEFAVSGEMTPLLQRHSTNQGWCVSHHTCSPLPNQSSEKLSGSDVSFRGEAQVSRGQHHSMVPEEMVDYGT